MTPLLFAFFALGALICALITLDHDHADVPSQSDRRRRENNSHLHSAEGELRPDAEVESGHTATGVARGQ